MMNASGTFDVQLHPLEPYAQGKDGITLGRMSINKIFQGGLVASSIGEMLSALTAVDGSAGYVAIEQVSGTLEGKTGSFVLQHYGTMADGNDFLMLGVVPGSGSGDLEGISGKMTLRIENGQHFFEFDYHLGSE